VLHVSYVLLKHISFVVVNLLLLVMRNYYLCYLLDLRWILVLEWELWRLLEVKDLCLLLNEIFIFI